MRSILLSTMTASMFQTVISLRPSCYFANVTGVPIIAGYSCPEHFLCLNTTSTDPDSLPQVCPASPTCIPLRIFNPDSKPQGDYEPQVCPYGNYCPDYITKIICPAGSFCPTGSTAPKPCPSLSNCPEGARAKRDYSGIIMCTIIDLVLAALYLLLKWRRRRLINRVNVTDAESKLATTDPKQYESQSRILKSSHLLEAYKKAFARMGGDNHGFPHLDFRFENLALTLPGGKTILSGVNGSMNSGRLTAIMGPSGAGKTTFMNVLMGKVKRSNGKLFVNDQQAELGDFKNIVGYVPQEDIMIRELTVREIIAYSARTRLPSSWTAKEVDQYVTEVIMTLGLTHVQHSYIGDETSRGISGGQRKRVNIGIELAAAPLTIFADEPTSGLDSTAALTVAETLKNIAHMGVTVISVLHQPRVEIFYAFDDILLLVPGGQTAYIGPREDIIPYFESLGFIFESMQNPADVLMDILSGKGKNTNKQIAPPELASLWQEKLKPTKGEIEEKSPLSKSVHSILQLDEIRKNSSFFMQIWLSHNRSVVQQLRLFGSFVLEVAVACLAGALMGMAVMGVEGEMFRGIYVSPMTLISPAPLAWIIPLLGLLVAMAVGLSGGPAGVKIFGEEKPVYWREASAGHSKLAYYIGKVISVVYRFVLTSLHFTSVFYVLAQPTIPFGRMYLVLLMDFYCVYGLASIVSMVTRRENASLLAVVVCLFAATISGFGPSITDARKWGISFLWEISYARWGAEAIYTEEVEPFRGIYDVEASAAVYGYTLGRFTLDVGLMLIIGTVMRVIAFVLLVTTHRNKQK